MTEILFVCVSNAGKSQMAEALAHKHLADARRTDVVVSSAGTHPKGSVNAESAASVAEVGADMTQARSKAIDPDVLHRADWVVVLGDSAQLELPAGAHGRLVRWSTDEPSQHGIEGAERMCLIRDEIDARVRGLLGDLEQQR